MLKALLFTTSVLVATSALANDAPKKDRPVGDDSTDLAPLDQSSKPLPEDHNNLNPGSAEQGGGVSDAAKPDASK